MRRGDVYYITFEPRSWSEQRGLRPAVVISSDKMNRNPKWQSFVVIPITSKIRLQSPTMVVFQAGIANLSQASAVICHQITTIDRSKFGTFIGSFSSTELAQIEKGIQAALGMF